MKKALIITLLLFSLVISACEREVELPDLEGKTEAEIKTILEDKGLHVNFLMRQNIEKEKSNQFVEYGRNLSVGQRVPHGSFVTVHVSATLDEDVVYFEPVDIPYDGPYLDGAFFDVDYFTYDEDAERYIGGGGAFHVTYEDGRWVESRGGCIDGDTSVFTYPPEIYERIESGTPSTRYLNLDTPETWPPDGREEWGQPATQYVCDVLAEAEEIVLQTDPGDNLLGNYGRLLAWIWVRMADDEDFKLLNYMIVRQGLGVVAYEFGAGETDVTVYDGMRYNEWMHYAEAMAKEEERGMHSDVLRDYYWDYENDAPHPVRWPD